MRKKSIFFSEIHFLLTCSHAFCKLLLCYYTMPVLFMVCSLSRHSFLKFGNCIFNSPVCLSIEVDERSNHVMLTEDNTTKSAVEIQTRLPQSWSHHYLIKVHLHKKAKVQLLYHKNLTRNKRQKYYVLPKLLTQFSLYHQALLLHLESHR